MEPTQRNCDEFGRHRGDLTDLDFYRRRAAELRLQTIRNGIGPKATCVGLLMIVAFPIAFAVTAVSLHALTSTVSARTNTVPAR